VTSLPAILAAPSAADPYPFYAEILARRPFAFDDELGAFVAADGASVRAVLADRRFLVRPLGEPVPPPLLGSPAGALFAHLVRMDDSPHQERRKAAIVATLGGLAAAEAGSKSRQWARQLIADEVGLSELAFRLPVFTLGELLGLPVVDLPRIEELVGDWVRCLASGSSPLEIERGKSAAEELLARFGEVLDGPPGLGGGLLAELARRLPGERPAILANGIGFLMQAYEATAGLISNAFLVLVRSAAGRQEPLSLGRIPAIVRETARWDPPVQNTRRFVAEPFSLRGNELEAGQRVFLLLAAANRDPAFYARPADFDPDRREGEITSFGLGAHACPGRRLAETLAVSALEALAEGGALPQEAPAFSYRPSQNTRIPIFGHQSNGSQP